ncbi:DUF333 domain-containing protein [Candidatus Woesearchaeota archaeon]|nr:DUF333 domain-containing protein [Candidatus Woesearchaeota archaeon]
MIAALALLIAGCGTETVDDSTDKTTDTTTGTATDNVQDTGNTQIANPASVFCEEQGGTLTIVDEEAGQTGMCTLANGTVCEEWAYFRGECGSGEDNPGKQVACTEEAKMCPDGSAVGRTGPDCEFAPCPE